MLLHRLWCMWQVVQRRLVQEECADGKHQQGEGDEAASEVCCSYHTMCYGIKSNVREALQARRGGVRFWEACCEV
jgi:hypothetical protein